MKSRRWHVFLRRLRVHHLIGMTAVAIAYVRAKRRHFYGRGRIFRLVARFRFLHHDDDTELRADHQAVRENLRDALGSSIGGHVVIGRLAVEQNVAHTPADEVGLVARRAQRPANVLCECASVHVAIMRESRLGWKNSDCWRRRVGPRDTGANRGPAYGRIRRTSAVMSSCCRA